MKITRIIFTALALAGAGAVFDVPAAAKVTPENISWNRELVITHIFPVEKSDEAKATNPKARFTLEHLLVGIAKDGKAETAARQWLNSWVVVWDGTTYPIGQKLLKQWENHPHTDPHCPPGKQLCFLHAPFRLLAIVNRPDMQKRDDDLKPHSAGEVRFVFGITDASGGQRNALAIFEYDMKGENADELHDWQDQWHRLNKFQLATEAYCQALATITEKVVARGVRPDLTNGSALKKIRTNEVELSEDEVQDDALWNLREFVLAKSGDIVATTTEQTPREELANTQELADYVNAEEARILKSRYVVPNALLGSQANIPLNPQERVWLPPDAVNPPHINNAAARDRFARNTCNGCHGGETGTNNIHVHPRDAGVPSILSKSINRSNTKEIMARKKFMCAALNRTMPPPPTAPMGGSLPPDKDAQELLTLLMERAGHAH